MYNDWINQAVSWNHGLHFERSICGGMHGSIILEMDLIG